MFTFELTKPQLKVLANVFGNFVVVWIVAMFGTMDAQALTVNFILAILSWYAGISVEKELEKYD